MKQDGEKTLVMLLGRLAIDNPHPGEDETDTDNFNQTNDFP